MHWYCEEKLNYGSLRTQTDFPTCFIRSHGIMRFFLISCRFVRQIIWEIYQIMQWGARYYAGLHNILQVVDWSTSSTDWPTLPVSQPYQSANSTGRPTLLLDQLYQLTDRPTLPLNQPYCLTNSIARPTLPLDWSQIDQLYQLTNCTALLHVYWMK